MDASKTPEELADAAKTDPLASRWESYKAIRDTIHDAKGQSPQLVLDKQAAAASAARA